jgi:hypothetical protein
VTDRNFFASQSVLPFALLLTKVKVAKMLSVCVLLWGITCLLTIVVTSYEGLVVQVSWSFDPWTRLTGSPSVSR